MGGKQLAGVFADRTFYRRMLSIAFPVIIQNFISSFLNMIDTVMVGKLGETEIAAVGIANQYFFFFLMCMIGLGGGCAVLSAVLGAKDVKKSAGFWDRALFGLLVAGVFMLVGYFPHTGNRRVQSRSRVLALGSCCLQLY